MRGEGAVYREPHLLCPAGSTYLMTQQNAVALEAAIHKYQLGRYFFIYRVHTL